jgi:hypothetical protein
MNQALQAAETEQATSFDAVEEIAQKAKKPKKEKVVKEVELDEEGNPVKKAKKTKEPKLDADGNPIPKAPTFKVDDTHIICLPKNEAGEFLPNPKRANTNAYSMFELYRDGMTVAQYVEAGGGRDWVRWDVSKGYITLG